MDMREISLRDKIGEIMNNGDSDWFLYTNFKNADGGFGLLT